MAKFIFHYDTLVILVYLLIYPSIDAPVNLSIRLLIKMYCSSEIEKCMRYYA